MSGNGTAPFVRYGPITAPITAPFWACTPTTRSQRSRHRSRRSRPERSRSPPYVHIRGGAERAPRSASPRLPDGPPDLGCVGRGRPLTEAAPTLDPTRARPDQPNGELTMARQPETGPSLSRTIRRMQREQVRQRGSSSWAESGASVTPGQVVVDGTLLVHGDTRIEGTLSLPNGIVDNAALSSPVVPGAAHDDAQGFALTTAYSWLLSVDVPVPAGFTSALVTVALTASAKNTTTATDYVYASTAAAGVAPGGWVVGSGAVPAGQYGVGLDLRTFVLSGLAGSFLIEGALFTAYGAWAADGSNVANIDASILFLR